jgi:hypothetical protein
LPFQKGAGADAKPQPFPQTLFGLLASGPVEQQHVQENISKKAPSLFHNSHYPPEHNLKKFILTEFGKIIDEIC